MKNIAIGSLSIPLTQYASQGNAVLGIRDSGKSYSATYLGEQLHAANIPFVAFDPSGVWKFLRVPGKGPGLPIVVAGGKAPDLPLTPQSAPEIVRAAMRANVSLVLDLYDINMSKADWSRIVESCVRVLLYENGEHGLRHIFIEEAAEFAPQQIAGDKARVYAEIEKLARIGGNALLGYTLINQRAEQVNKAVLELCDCLFLHRQKGKNSLTSLAKWLEYSQGGATKEIIKSLPTLPSGTCWVWPAGAEEAVRVKMPEKRSFHPDRRALIANPAAANVKRVDASQFVTELKGSLEKFLKEAEENDPKLLRKRIAELERQVRQPGASRQELETARRKGLDEGYAAASAAIAGKVLSVIRAGDDFMQRLRGISEAIEKTAPLASKAAAPVLHKPVPTRLSAPAPASPARQRSTDRVDKPMPRAMLTALAQHPDGLSKGQILVHTGYRSSGPVSKCFAELGREGWVEARGGNLAITRAGLDALGDYEPLPTGADLRDYLLHGDKVSTMEKAMLRCLFGAYPDAIAKGQILEQAGYASSGPVSKAFARLVALGYAVQSGRGELRASEDLF